jgi:plastocyanin
MNHITLFGVATICLTLVGSIARACDVHGEDYSRYMSTPVQLAAASAIAADIKGFQYKPKAITVRAGETVTWTNQDGIEHSVTSGTPDAAGMTFDTGLFTKGEARSITFDEPGTYAFFCARHNSMKGTVTVLPPE